MQKSEAEQLRELLALLVEAREVVSDLLNKINLSSQDEAEALDLLRKIQKYAAR